MRIFVKKWYSKKNKKEYIALCCCLSYGMREKVLTFDRYIIAEYLGVLVAELDDVDCGIHEVINVEQSRKE